MASNRLAFLARKSLAMGPSVRNLLNQYKLDPGRIVSTGPHQTLLKSDVVAYISQHQMQPAIHKAPPVPIGMEQSTKAPQIGRETMIVEASNGPNRYARSYPSQFEIDVINSGGIVE